MAHTPLRGPAGAFTWKHLRPQLLIVQSTGSSRHIDLLTIARTPSGKKKIMGKRAIFPFGGVFGGDGGRFNAKTGRRRRSPEYAAWARARSGRGERNRARSQAGKKRRQHERAQGPAAARRPPR